MLLGLLYLCDKASGTDGVNATRRQEEHIARRHFITLENVHDSVIAYPFHILLCVNLLGETGIEASSLRGVDYVPHFGLAKRIVAFHSQLVVGMHLDRQVITGVDKLNQQRESRAELVHYLLTEQLLAVSANQFIERLAFQVTVIDDGIVTLYMRKFPTFTDTFFTGVMPLNGQMSEPPQIIFLRIGLKVIGYNILCVLLFDYFFIFTFLSTTALRAGMYSLSHSFLSFLNNGSNCVK